jgi:polyhydroxyalkanoate synthase
VVGSRDYTEVELPGGHIGVYVGLKSPRSVPSAVSEWMSVRR